MLDIVKKFYNKVGTKYNVVETFPYYSPFYKNDIIELIAQDSCEIDEILNNIDSNAEFIKEKFPYLFKSLSTGREQWTYVKNLHRLEEYNKDIIELENKLNIEMVKKIEIFDKIDCLTHKLHESKEFKELELAHREINKSIERLKIEIQKAKNI